MSSHRQNPYATNVTTNQTNYNNSRYTNNAQTPQLGTPVGNNYGQTPEDYYGQQQQQTAEVAQPEIVHMKTIISQQEHSNLPQQGGSEQLFVQTNLSPEKLEVEQIRDAKATVSTTDKIDQVKNVAMKKAAPQHADTPSLLAIREATASNFADLN